MEFFSISILLCFFLLFISLSLSLPFYFLSNKHKRKTLPLPPGSTGWPMVGESHDFLATGRKGHPEKFIFDRISKYSSYVFKTNLLGSPAVVFCGSASNKFLFSNENKLVQAWWPSSVDKIFPSTSPKTSSKQEAMIFRKMLPNFLKPEALKNYIGIMDSIANRHFDSDWTNNDNNRHGQGDEVVVFPLTKQYTFWLACRLFISVEDPNHIAKFAVPFGIMAAGILTLPIDLPGTSFRRGIKAAEFIRKELSAIIKQRKVDLRKGKASATQDILSHMLLTSDEDGKLMVEADIANKILGLLIGGHDAASSACASIVMYLAEFPDVYQRVYQEQMKIAKSKAPGGLLNWNDIKKMKYSWNVACEAMRLASPLQGAFREAMTDFVYNGFSIPKGWKIYWSASSTHKNSKYFPEPHKFDPSRFEGCGPAPYTYVPFGGGPRMCPGKEYARLEILVFMHNLVKRFKWEKLIPNEKFVFNPMPNPEKGLPIRLFPHKA